MLRGRFRDELAHVAFQREWGRRRWKSSTLRRGHEGLAHAFLASRRFTGTRVLTVEIRYAACGLFPKPAVSTNTFNNLVSRLCWLNKAAL
jgi:hypothetical protein